MILKENREREKKKEILYKKKIINQCISFFSLNLIKLINIYMCIYVCVYMYI